MLCCSRLSCSCDFQEGGAHEKTPCPYCGQIFNSSGGLHYHLRTVHNYVEERTKRRQMTVGKVEVKNEGQVGVVATNSNVVEAAWMWRVLPWMLCCSRPSCSCDYQVEQRGIVRLIFLLQECRDVNIGIARIVHFRGFRAGKIVDSVHISSCTH